LKNKLKVMPTAIQGAVIVKKDGLNISYKQKCEKCGNVRRL